MSRRNTDGPTQYNKDSTVNYIIDAYIYIIARICAFANIRCTDKPGRQSLILLQTCCCPQLLSAARNSWNTNSNFSFALHDVLSTMMLSLFSALFLVKFTDKSWTLNLQGRCLGETHCLFVWWLCVAILLVGLLNHTGNQMSRCVW